MMNMQYWDGETTELVMYGTIPHSDIVLDFRALSAQIHQIVLFSSRFPLLFLLLLLLPFLLPQIS